LDIGFWHDTFVTYPSFLSVLATVTGSGQVAALGGAEVVLGEAVTLDPDTQTASVGATATVTATVQDDNGDPVVGRTVEFDVTSGPNAGASGSGVTDASGNVSFSYIGGAAGTDTVVASFIDSQSQTQTSNEVEVVWEITGTGVFGGLGFWKNNADLWPTNSLTIGGISYTKDELLTVFSTPARGDAVLILAYQLIAAKLNVANGADSSSIASVIADADSLLTGINLLSHTKVKTSTALGHQMTTDAGLLEAFNDTF
jgi:hypothetical protein